MLVKLMKESGKEKKKRRKERGSGGRKKVRENKGSRKDNYVWTYFSILVLALSFSNLNVLKPKLINLPLLDYCGNYVKYYISNTYSRA